MRRPRSFWCLHGNLGLPSDWQDLLDAWASVRGVPCGERLSSHGDHRVQIGSDRFHCVDLWSDEVAASPERWAEAFLKRVSSERDEERVLIGYSLGGRLAMEAVVKAPRVWTAVVLVSNHPAGLSEEQRVQRRIFDEEWASAFEDCSLRWVDVLERWNTQPVFRSRRKFGARVFREEREFDRSKVAEGLRCWSLANMSVSLSDVARTLVPTLWVVGCEDEKMMRECETLRGHLASSVQPIVLDGGHRLLHENPQALARAIDQFLQ